MTTYTSSSVRNSLKAIWDKYFASDSSVIYQDFTVSPVVDTIGAFCEDIRLYLNSINTVYNYDSTSETNTVGPTSLTGYNARVTIKGYCDTAFPTGTSTIVQDLTTTPITDTVTPFTNNIAGYVDTVNPDKHYPSIKL